MKEKIFLLALAVILTGCAKLQYLDELLTLKSYSDEQTAMDKLVSANDKKITLLIEQVKSGEIKQYKDKAAIRKAFCEPVLEKEVEKDGKVLVLNVYNRSKEFFDSEKANLYFDKDGTLNSWEYIPKM